MADQQVERSSMHLGYDLYHISSRLPRLSPVQYRPIVQNHRLNCLSFLVIAFIHLFHLLISKQNMFHMTCISVVVTIVIKHHVVSLSLSYLFVDAFPIPAASLCEVIVYVVQVYELLLHYTSHSDHNVITGSLETLQQLLRSPPPQFLASVLMTPGSIPATSIHPGDMDTDNFSRTSSK